MFARSIGLRANATAIDVPSSMCSVCSAASSSGKNGSCPVSAVHTPEYPAASAAGPGCPPWSDPFRCFRRPTCVGPYWARTHVRRSVGQPSIIRRPGRAGTAPPRPPARRPRAVRRHRSAGRAPGWTGASWTWSGGGVARLLRVVDLLELADHRSVLVVPGDQFIEARPLEQRLAAQRRGVDADTGGVVEALDQRR